MPKKKKITIGLSSKNGQKYLLERYKIARKENDEQVIEEIENLLDSEDIETVEIFFRKPSYKDGGLLGGSDEAWKKYAEEQQKELTENTDKLHLLCDHYGIANNRFKYLNLSIELARELYPEPGKKGRPTKWDDDLICILIIEMEMLMSSHADASNKGITWAATQLAKNQDWLEFLEKKDREDTTPDPAESLRTQYQRNFNKINPDVKQRLENYPPERLQELKNFLMRKRVSI